MRTSKIILMLVLTGCAARTEQPPRMQASSNPCAALQQASGVDAALECAFEALQQDASMEAWEFFLAMRQERQQQAEARLGSLLANYRFSEAARLAESLWSASAEPEKLCELAELWFLAGDLGQAAQHYDRILDQMFLPPLCALQGRAEIARLEKDQARFQLLSKKLTDAGGGALAMDPPENESRWLAELQAASALTASDVALLLVRLGPSRARGELPTEGLYDVAAHPARSAIEEALARGWMRPGAYGLFRPDRLVQRVELGLWLLEAASAQQEKPRPNLPGWRKAFPELAALWALPPFLGMQSPRELFAPVSGSEAIELIRRFRAKASESQ